MVLVPSERLTAIRSVDTSTWPVRTRCDSDVLELDVIAMTAKGQYLRRRCGPLVLVQSGRLLFCFRDARFGM
jgi:hypothetical protein